MTTSTKDAKNAKAGASEKPDPGTLYVPANDLGLTEDMTQSQLLVGVIGKGLMAAQVTKAYANVGPDMTIGDLMVDMKAAGDDVVCGELGRMERMLTQQAITLDTLFSHLALKAKGAEYVKNFETYMRLALKAQSQARTTAETLALMKNPQPYIRQANIAHGHQQVNNGTAHQVPSVAGETNNFSQSKLLEKSDANILDTRAPGTTVGANQGVEALGTLHRAKIG